VIISHTKFDKHCGTVAIAEGKFLVLSIAVVAGLRGEEKQSKNRSRGGKLRAKEREQTLKHKCGTWSIITLSLKNIFFFASN